MIEREIEEWLQAHEYDSLDQLKRKHVSEGVVPIPMHSSVPNMFEEFQAHGEQSAVKRPSTVSYEPEKRPQKYCSLSL